MKNIPPELQEKVRKYSLAVAWWLLYENHEDMAEKLKNVLERIEKIEEELRLSGVNNTTLDGIREKAQKFVTMTIGEMNEAQLETMCKLIFGQDHKLTPREKPKPWHIYFDPIKYAQWTMRNGWEKIDEKKSSEV